MSTTLYFSKVNVNSHIFSVYEKPQKLMEILNLLLVKIKNDIGFDKEVLRHDENGEAYVYKAHYKFSSIEKLGSKFNNAIVGNVIKTFHLFVNKIDDDGKVIRIPVENNEVVRFYFDVYKETVAFHRTSWFGYVDFTEAFKQLLNASMKDCEEEYNFEVSLLRKGLNIQEIKSQLKKIGVIETLRIEIIPPNPNGPLLNGISSNGEKFLESAKEGNVTSRSILFTSKAQTGLLLDSEIVSDELEKVETIHSKLSDEEAVGKGYVTVEASSKNGRVYSTKDSNPIKDKIADGIVGITEFAETCMRKITSIFGD